MRWVMAAAGEATRSAALSPMPTAPKHDHLCSGGGQGQPFISYVVLIYARIYTSCCHSLHSSKWRLDHVLEALPNPLQRRTSGPLPHDETGPVPVPVLDHLHDVTAVIVRGPDLHQEVVVVRTLGCAKELSNDGLTEALVSSSQRMDPVRTMLLRLASPLISPIYPSPFDKSLHNTNTCCDTEAIIFPVLGCYALTGDSAMATDAPQPARSWRNVRGG